MSDEIDSSTDGAVEHFFRSIENAPPGELYIGKDSCLADLIKWWMSDYGVWGCMGSEKIFLAAMPIIIHRWLLDPTLTDYVPTADHPNGVERRVTRIFRSDEGGHEILHPNFFTRCHFFFFHERYDRVRGR